MSNLLDQLPEAVRLTHTRHGLMLYPAPDMYVGPCLETYGEYSPEEAQLLRQLLKPGDVALEVGANIGAHTVAMSEFVGPGGQVHAIEPQRLIFQMLCANLALSHRLNVTARQLGLGAAPGTLWVSPPKAAAAINYGGVSLENQGQERVEILTLDSLVFDRLDFIKIDVEGMEEAVIQGGAQTITRLRPKLYIENDRADRSASLIRTIRALGYRLWWHLPGLTSLNNFKGAQHRIFTKHYISINMVCIPAEQQTKTDLVEILADTDRPVY